MKDQSISQELARIERANNRLLTPDAVVSAARSENSALHDHFTWDDSEAAHKWRLNEARDLISRYRVIETIETEEKVVPYYVRDPRQGDGQGYRSLPYLRSNEDVARDAVRREFKFALGALERAMIIAKALDLANSIEALVERQEQLCEEFEKALRPPRPPRSGKKNRLPPGKQERQPMRL